MTDEVKGPRKVQYGARMIQQHARVGDFRLEFYERELPPTLNSLLRLHWAKRKRLNDLWHRIVDHHVGSSKPRRPLTRARVTMIRRGLKELDYDNLAGSFKCVLDSLKYCGVLKDDTMTCIGQTKYIFEKVKRKDVGIHVLIEGGSNDD